MKTTQHFLFLIFLFCFQAAVAQQKFSKVKIKLPASPAERSAVIAMMDADHFSPEGDGIVAEISEYAQKQLRAAGYSFDVLIDDVTTHFVEESKKFCSDFSWE
jgi:hypothetical protein